MDTNQQASRAAKRILSERVRSDFAWPNVPEPWLASDEEVFEVTEFRERYYGTSASEEPEADTAGSNKAAAAAADPYKFDSPESIGDDVAQKKLGRKRKRRADQEEEMEWNDGLKMFVERRDVWTGAASVKKYGTGGGKKDTGLTATSSRNDPSDPLIPVAPKFLPDNPIRMSIKPSAYPDIYNNIVVTNRTPSVPINLADMTRALVIGWKEAGEWPPRVGPLDPLAGGRKRSVLKSEIGLGGEGPFLAHHPHVKRGVDSVKRMLHLNGQDTGLPEKER